MDIHEDRWPRHLHLVHLVLPTVHLLCRSRSHRAAVLSLSGFCLSFGSKVKVKVKVNAFTWVLISFSPHSY